MADLHVSKKTIYKLYGDMQDRKFIIPEFQRPYKWDIELCETLWNDIEEFASNEALTGSDYFLGTIVSYQNDKKDLEIIDGQQRITSFLLLLRAFYRKLEDMDQTKPSVIGLKNQIAPCIWDVDSISQVVTDRTKIRIKSLVVTEEDNDIFHEILETGVSNQNAEDNYSKNYRFFKSKCDEYAQNNPMEWERLCVTILKQCIILPIECDTSETALKIFSTLNDRGLPLADSDVFKAEIYKSIETTDKRRKFTDDWNELTSFCKNANISLDDVFRYYMHIIRARTNDGTKEVGLRKFYAGRNSDYIHLKNHELIKDLLLLANFWTYVNTRKDPSDDDGYTISVETRKYFHCLSWYPNDYWKYPVSVFFLKYRESITFDIDLCSLLKRLLSILFFKFIYSPSINAIRDDIYNIYISIQNCTKWSINLTLNNESFYKRLTEEFASPPPREFLEH
jgi:hypothetical protein